MCAWQRLLDASDNSPFNRGMAKAAPLKCPGVGRDKDCISALQFYFSRKVTDDEMRFLHEVMQRAVASIGSVQRH